MWRAIRDKRYTYAIYLRDKSELLFDNQADPWQMTNLVKNPAAAEARKLLAQIEGDK